MSVQGNSQRSVSPTEVRRGVGWDRSQDEPVVNVRQLNILRYEAKTLLLETNLFTGSVESVTVAKGNHTQRILHPHVRGTKVTVSDCWIEIIVVTIRRFAFAFPK